MSEQVGKAIYIFYYISSSDIRQIRIMSHVAISDYNPYNYWRCTFMIINHPRLPIRCPLITACNESARTIRVARSRSLSFAFRHALLSRAELIFEEEVFSHTCCSQVRIAFFFLLLFLFLDYLLVIKDKLTRVQEINVICKYCFYLFSDFDPKVDQNLTISEIVEKIIGKITTTFELLIDFFSSLQPWSNS